MDHGWQFESNLWRPLTAILGSKKAPTTSYHPQASGIVEQLHCQLKAFLMAHCDPTSWLDSLPLVLLGISTALKEDTHSKAAEMVYSTTPLPRKYSSPLPHNLP